MIGRIGTVLYAACGAVALAIGATAGGQSPGGAAPAPSTAAEAPAAPLPKQNFGTAGTAEQILQQNEPPPLEKLPRPPADSRDFEGTWISDQLTELRLTQDMYGNPLPYKPEAKALLARRVKATYVIGTPYANAGSECRPPGQPWQFGLIYPFQIYQNTKEMVFLFSEYHTIWSIRLNQPHRAWPQRQYMGDSVGRWDGETLVADTVGYKNSLWLDPDGTPATRNAHLTFRIRRIDYGVPKLEILTTVDDPKLYTRPWSIVRTYAWRPDFALLQEYNCEWQMGAPGGVERYGLTPDPEDQDL